MKWRVFATCLLVLLAACTSASPTTEPTPSPTAEETVAPTASASPTASPSPTEEPSEPAAADQECESEPPTAESDDWTEHTGVTPDYGFSTPDDWVVREPPPTLDLVTAVSPETFDTIGFPDFAVLPVDLVSAANGSIGVSAWVIESRIDTPTDELFAAELAWLEEQPQIVEVLDDGLETCIDGSTALGFSSTWAFPNGDQYIELYVLQRNGKVYEAQLTAQDDSGSDVFAEVLRTWEWTEPLEGDGDGGSDGGGGTGDPGDVQSQLDDTDFDRAVLMSDFDQNDWPDDPPPQSAFEDSFGPDGRIWIVFRLDPDVTDTVVMTWYLDGEAVTDESTLDYSEDTTFAWGYLDPGSGFNPGNWEVVLELEDGGDRITVPYEVTD